MRTDPRRVEKPQARDTWPLLWTGAATETASRSPPSQEPHPVTAGQRRCQAAKPLEILLRLVNCF